MGLTIHWKLRLDHDSDPGEVLEKLRQAARSLPVAQVDRSVASLRGSACRLRARSPGELTDRDLLLITASRFVGEDDQYTSVPPTELHSFRVHPGPGSESAVFFLAKYPERVSVNGQVRKVPGAKVWSSSSWCKTQYASNHGIENFVRCHLSVIAILDRARELGFKVVVRDDGHFQTTRSVPRLIEAVTGWNELIAGFGALLDQSIRGTTRVSGLTGRQDLEHLEARGLEHFRDISSFVKKLSSPRAPRSTRRRNGGSVR